jgi:hypothetical protein
VSVLLRSERIEVELQPERGAEVASVRSLASGRELLFEAPWEPTMTPDRGLDGDAWVADWRGGWQVLVPNAGEATEVEGRRYPFHGDAALAAWSVHECSGSEAVLVWRDGDSGLSIERTARARGRTLSVTSEIVNDSSEAVPYVFVEHPIFGPPLLAPTSRVELPGGRIVPLDPIGRTEGEGSDWPLLDGDDWSRMSEEPLGRFGAIVGLPRGHARLVDDASGLAATVTWPISLLPFLWYWLESRATAEPPWSSQTVCLGLEPASVPTADGLGAALQRGHARTMKPGARVRLPVAVAFEEREERP